MNNEEVMTTKHIFKNNMTLLECKRCGVKITVPYITPPGWTCSFCANIPGLDLPKNQRPSHLLVPMIALAALSSGFFLGWLRWL